MKTLRLITAMIMVVGLIGVFSAFSAEQTKQKSKKEGVLTDTQKTKDQKKTLTPGSSSMQPPAANLQSLPLTIQKLYVKDGTVHVVIKKQGSKKLSDEDYAATKLKVDASTLKKPLEWTLPEVDPHKRFTRRVRWEQDFDTGLAVTKARTRVTATLYRGLWKTAKEGNLFPKMAEVDLKTRMAAPEKKKDAFRDQVLMDAPGPDSRGVAKGPGCSRYGVEVEQPRRGAIHSPGDHIQVLWQCDEEYIGECGEGTWDIVLMKGELWSGADLETIETLYSGPATPGTPVEVILPADLDDGDDYFVYINFAPVEITIGYSGNFSIGSTMLPIPDVSPSGIHLIEPNGGETWIQGLATEIRWEIYPIILPVQDNITIKINREDGRTAGSIRLSASDEELGFNNATRVYSYTYIPSSNPDRYRVSVEVPGLPGEMLSDSSELITIEPPFDLDEAITIHRPIEGSLIHAGDDLYVRWSLNDDYEDIINSDLYTHTGTDIAVVRGEDDFLTDVETFGPTVRECDIPIPAYTSEGAYYVMVRTNVEYAGYRAPSDDRRYGEAHAFSRIEILPNEGYFFVVPGPGGPVHDYYQGLARMIRWNALGEAQSGNVDIDLYDDSGMNIDDIGTYRNTRPDETNHSYTWVVCAPMTDESTIMEDVHIRLRNNEDPTITAESRPITIRKPTVTITTPAGGSTWRVGDRVTVSWSTEEPRPPEDFEVQIVIYPNGYGGGGHHIIATVPINRGSYTWELTEYSDFGRRDDYTIALIAAGPCGYFLAESAPFSMGD